MGSTRLFTFCLVAIPFTFLFAAFTYEQRQAIYDRYLSDGRAVFPESRLAHALLDGLSGIEIGASAHNPFGLQSLNVDYSASNDTVFKLEELRRAGVSARVDVVAEGNSLPFDDDSQDFVISSHVLEHFYDVIGTVGEWLRVVRPGGLVYVVLPDKGRIFDWRRESTSVEELVARHEKVVKGKLDGGRWHRGHHAYWTRADFLELCRSRGWKVIASQEVDDKVGNGFTVVIQKPYYR